VIAWSAVGSLVLLCVAAGRARAQNAPLQPITHIASLAPGSIHGTVLDDVGAPVMGAMVSALGASTAFAVTDKAGHFELRTLSPGPYIVRAHLAGYIASRGQLIEVRPSSRSSSAIALRRAAATSGSLPVMTAGIGPASDAVPQPPEATATSGTTVDDDHGEVAWRLRHARRSILKDVVVPDEILADDTPPDGTTVSDPGFFGHFSSSARTATTLFAGTPFSGQLNLLTTGSFDTPQQLFTTNNFQRSVAYLTLGAPVGEHADWTAHAALTQGDITSWIVAGEYTTRAPARHRYDLGVSYSTQRYDGGNVAALRGVTDGSRNAGELYGFDTFSISRGVTTTYGARYAKYDYLAGRSLVSPRVAVTYQPIDRFRVSTMISHREVAPGAEEFVPRVDNAIWLPPQRTFASLLSGRALKAERVDHMEIEVERDIATATVSLRGFRQHVDDQLVTLFGVDMPGAPAAHLGHYFVHNSGDLDAIGVSAGVRAAFARHVRGSIEYSVANARWQPTADARYLILFAPSAERPEIDRVHDVSTSIETEVPETSTRVLVLYRVSNGFAHQSDDHSALDSRFDVQVRQSLPFMDFSTAKWEMLVAVRNLFRDTAVDQSVYDELLVVRPPKRVVGGITLKF
jgi:hypothetical protein